MMEEEEEEREEKKRRKKQHLQYSTLYSTQHSLCIQNTVTTHTPAEERARMNCPF